MKKLLVIFLFCTAASASIFINSFNSGRLSKDLKVRADFERHTMGSETLTNILIRPQGMAYKRPGTEYIATCPNDLTFPGPQIAGDYTKYFGFIIDYTNGYIGTKVGVDWVVDTTWGDAGYFYYEDPDTGEMPFIVFDALQLANGNMLVATDEFHVGIGAERMFLVMINPSTGAIITSWGENGFAGSDATFMQIPYRVLQDNDGNFHIFGQSTSFSYFVLSEDGTTVLRQMSNNASLEANTLFYDARWVDDSKTQIIVGSSVISVLKLGVGWYSINMVMVDAATSTLDTSWAGNVDYAGYAKFGTTSVQAVRSLTDGFFIYLGNSLVTDTAKKVLSDGSALDTSWGTDGGVILGRMNTNPSHHNTVQNGDEIYLISYTYVNPQWYANFTRLDETGAVVDSAQVTAVSEGWYWGIDLINDKILISGKSGFYVWSADLVYETYTQIAGIDSCCFIVSDEITREYIDTTVTITFPAGSPVRLIPFEYAVNDAYVLELGHNYVGFLRTTE